MDCPNGDGVKMRPMEALIFQGIEKKEEKKR